MNEPMSLREIAKEEGISHQAVIIILERAYRKIRKILKNKGFKAKDFI